MKFKDALAIIMGYLGEIQATLLVIVAFFYKKDFYDDVINKSFNFKKFQMVK